MSFIYVLKLGADLEILSIVSVFLFFWGAMTDSFSGHLQDKIVCPTPRRFGRVSPWIFTHFILLAVSVLMAYAVPDDFEQKEVWYTIVSMSAAWCSSTVFVCYYTTLSSIFPFKEERSKVHANTMVIALPGVFVGVTIYSAVMQDASLGRRMGLAIFSCLFIMLGLTSLPLYSRVKRTSNAEDEKRNGTAGDDGDMKRKKKSTLDVLVEILHHDSARTMLFKNFFDGTVGGAVAIFSFYLIIFYLEVRR